MKYFQFTILCFSVKDSISFASALSDPSDPDEMFTSSLCCNIIGFLFIIAIFLSLQSIFLILLTFLFLSILNNISISSFVFLQFEPKRYDLIYSFSKQICFIKSLNEI